MEEYEQPPVRPFLQAEYDYDKVSSTVDGKVYVCEIVPEEEGQKGKPRLVLSAPRRYENAVVQMNTATDFHFRSVQYGAKNFDQKHAERLGDTQDTRLGRLSMLANQQRDHIKRHLCPTQPQTDGFSDPDACFRPVSRPGTRPGTAAHALLENFNETHSKRVMEMRQKIDELIKNEESRSDRP